jgi:hypothetical protein
MPPIAPTFTPLEWRQLAEACKTVAENERKRAADTGAKYFERSAEVWERLAARCLAMTRPENG